MVYCRVCCSDGLWPVMVVNFLPWFDNVAGVNTAQTSTGSWCSSVTFQTLSWRGLMDRIRTNSNCRASTIEPSINVSRSLTVGWKQGAFWSPWVSVRKVKSFKYFTPPVLLLLDTNDGLLLCWTVVESSSLWLLDFAQRGNKREGCLGTTTNAMLKDPSITSINAIIDPTIAGMMKVSPHGPPRSTTHGPCKEWCGVIWKECTWEGAPSYVGKSVFYRTPLASKKLYKY